jgi:hypothetical protein
MDNLTGIIRLLKTEQDRLTGNFAELVPRSRPFGRDNFENFGRKRMRIIVVEPSEEALASLGPDVFLVAIAARESVAIFHTIKRFAAATRPYQRPESFTVRFWLRKST